MRNGQSNKRMPRKMEKFVVGYHCLNPIYLECCAFADDIILFANTQEKLKKNVGLWKEVLESQGLFLNINKTKAMVISNDEKSIKMIVNEETIEQVNSYKYLGSIVDSRGKSEEELNSRIQAANRVYYALQNKFLKHKEITEKTKISIYKAIYLPILLHGAENWILTKRQEQRVQAIEMKYLRKVMGVRRTDRIRNTEIRSKLKVKSAKEIIENKKLNWFGHLVRMPNDRNVKKIWKAAPGGKNKRGRPKTTWNNSVANILGRRGQVWNSATALAGDRKQWKKFVTSTSTP